jgi:hypothetical protein
MQDPTDKQENDIELAVAFPPVPGHVTRWTG